MVPVRMFLLIFSLVLSVSACSGPAAIQPADATLSRQPAEVSLGIESVAIRLTSVGHMLDYRYRVVDPVRAETILNRNTRTFLMHEKSGKVLAVPVPAKVGPLRQSTLKPETGRVYFMMFGNAGKLVHAGDLVTLIIGDQRIEHLTVE